MNKICGRLASKSMGADDTGVDAAIKNYHLKPPTIRTLVGIQATQTQPAQRSPSDPSETTGGRSCQLLKQEMLPGVEIHFAFFGKAGRAEIRCL